MATVCATAIFSEALTWLVGIQFTCCQDHVRIEVEDAGGPWRAGQRDDRRPHGFDVVAALAGPQNWGVDGDAHGRTAWARLSE